MITGESLVKTCFTLLPPWDYMLREKEEGEEEEEEKEEGSSLPSLGRFSSFPHHFFLVLR